MFHWHFSCREDSTYAEKFKDIAAGVAKAIPGAEVTGQVGREGKKNRMLA